ncbi:MAG: hypothetical protein KME12_05760 [Trichocoleus desertorum ATA4-8-CV12]|jgi:hypothetical protein|nr:hypothetical protein [Trichocoleus desertorum ATA4-8-CV12]
MFGVINSENSNEPILTVHGKPVDKKLGSILGHADNPKKLSVSIENLDLFRQIIKHTASEVTKNSSVVCFSTSIYPSERFEYFSIQRIWLISDNELFELNFEFMIDVENWNNPWSVLQHLNEFSSCVKKKSKDLLPLRNKNDDDFSWLEFEIYTEFSEDSLPLEYRITEIVNSFCAAHDEALINLSEKTVSEVLIQKFKFPLEVKIACEQYLLYFTEFLRDVGIEANASLREESGNVLFSVRPNNKDEALGNIKIALEIYLNLPNSVVLNTSQSLEISLPVQRLSSQIQFLQSQLTLANATIQQQNFLIAQQNQFIQSQQFSSQVLIDSLKAEDEADEEPLVGKIISIKEFEWGPLNLGLPELLRKMKEHFKKP